MKVKLAQLGFWSKTTPILFVLSCILCSVPLFNLLGFEFCFAGGLVLSLAHGISSAAQTNGLHAPIMKQWQETCQRLVGPCVALLVPILINGLFVQNCNWGIGFQWFLLIVVSSGIVSSGFGVLCSATSRHPRTTFLILWLVIISVGFARFLWTPQVDIFNLFAGYFPGALYDEVLTEEVRIFWSRCEDLSITWVLLALTAGFQRQIRLRTVCFSLLALVLFVMQAHRVDLRRSSQHVQSRLGGIKDTEHFTVYYPKLWSDDRIERLGVELEFLYQELVDELGVRPSERLKIYFYNSMNQKKRLMGARNTRIAKPWQNAFHVDAPFIGASVIRHELIHLFAAQFGAPPLGIAQNQFGLPNMALTEGLAEAYSPRDARLSLHEWTAALDRIGKRPDVQQLLSPNGFYSSSARSAYTVCGSLLRFTEEQYGLDAVKSWYQKGEWTGEVSLSTLLSQWTSFLKAVPLESNAITAAKAYFDRPSIFRRMCAHEVSSIREQVRHAIATHDSKNVFRHIDQLLAFNPKDRWARMRRLEHLAVTDQLDAALVQAQALNDDQTVGQATREIAQEWIADITLLSGSTKSAEEKYQGLLKNAFSRATIRRLEVKLYATQTPELSKALVRFLSFSRDQYKARHRVEALYRQFSTDHMVQYLRARHLFSQKHYLTAFKMLSELKTSQLPRSILLEIHRLCAVLSFRSHCYGAAHVQFTAITTNYQSILTAGEIAHLNTWSRRASFFDQSKRMKRFSCPLEIDNQSKPHHDVLHQE